jgi:transposase
MIIRTVYWLGIDVSKDSLQLFAKFLNFKIPAQIPNEAGAIGHFFKTLLKCPCLGGRALPRLRLICEPTGGFERALQDIAWKLGLKLSIVNPKRMRRYIEGCGISFKTDAIDARMIWQFGSERQPDPMPAPGELLTALRALVTRRSQLIKSLGEHRCQLAQHHHESVIKGCKALITIIKEQITAINAEMHQLAGSCPDLKARLRCLQQVKGVGFLVAITMLTLVPELGHLNRNEAAALLGVAPMNADSGKWKGRRFIQGGRAAARACLYMAALTAARCHPTLSEFYKRLIFKGKPKKLAIVAVMNKLAKILNSILKNFNHSNQTA